MTSTHRTKVLKWRFFDLDNIPWKEPASHDQSEHKSIYWRPKDRTLRFHEENHFSWIQLIKNRIRHSLLPLPHSSNTTSKSLRVRINYQSCPPTRLTTLAGYLHEMQRNNHLFNIAVLRRWVESYCIHRAITSFTHNLLSALLFSSFLYN